MQKKSIILLITLVFITMISILVLKNLEDTDQFLAEISHDTNLVQLNILDQNIKEEVTSLTTSYKDNIDDVLEITSMGVPFDFGNISTIVTLDRYTPSDCYLKVIKTVEELSTNCEDIIDNILYPYEFIEVLTQFKPNNKDQLDYFLKQYINKTRDNKVLEIKDQFGFFKSSNENNDTEYLRCEYKASINDINASGEFIYKLGTKDIISFEVSY